MLAYGNAEPQTCVNNLLKTYSKEAFYGRRKGISTIQQDMPFSSATDQLEADAEDMIEEFEERVEVNEVVASDDEDGGIVLTADIDIVNESLDEDEEEDDE